uniref:Lactosylceramide 4-alpha-galactosyltransferase n=1 Tax=Cacopsylla melanoneura TaxID=428564 RepID=A0A8D9AN34_9HEMI
MKKILLLCLALAVVHEGCSVENDKTACLHSGYENSFVYKDLTEMNVASNSIFFMETTCKHEAGVDLSPRQACSVESAAMMNPHTQVYVVIISSVGNRTWSPVIQRLYEYKNVEIVQVNLDRLFQNTPVQNFYIEDKISTSLWPFHHMSDILRLLVLYKYGGTYMDLDIVVIKSLENLHNYAGAESDTDVGSAIINIDKDHWLSDAAVKELRDHYDGTAWIANGVAMLTRLLNNECEQHQGYNEKLTQCQTDAFRSPDGKCIQMKYVRDRDNDCGEEVFFEVLLFVREHLYPTFPSSGTYPKMEFSNTVYVV